MQNITVDEQIYKLASSNEINLYRVKTDKFKTNTVQVFFHDELCRERAAKNALLPAVMRRGCGMLPTFKDIALYLEELYGASFDCGVVKKGERQIIHFYIDHISDKYTGDNKELFEKCLDLLFEIITNPMVEKGDQKFCSMAKVTSLKNSALDKAQCAFKREYVEQEKNNLKNLIESRINDKVHYAVERCFEEMCSGEPFSIYEYGNVEDLEGINEQNLFEHYISVIETSPIDIFVTGEIEDDRVLKAFKRFDELNRKSVKKINTSFSKVEVDKVKEVEEKLEVNQGKLCLGFRTNIPANDNRYYALVVYNSILGGGGFMNSKLFKNVREKESLAYYIFSRIEKYKGLMVISGGIEIPNKQKTIDIILEQMEEIKSGNISDYEYDATIRTIKTSMESLKDSSLSMVDFYLGQIVAGTNDTFASIIEKFEKVTKQDVIDIADNIKLDTIYFLN